MIRIIIRKDNQKLLNDANILNSIIKNSFIYVSDISNYKDHNNNILFNLYIDDALESDYYKFKFQKNILIINEKYYNQPYLVRYSFKDEPLLKNIDVMYYILCKFDFMYNYFSKNLNNKILKFPLLFNVENKICTIDKNSIFLNIDEYNCSENSLILITWIKNNYFEKIYPVPKLIINIACDKYKISNIFKYLVKTNHNNNFKNIIILKKNSTFCDYGCALITSSEYNIAYHILDEIKNKKFIITIKNIISQDILKNNTLYFKSFLIKDIGNKLKEYFNKNKYDIDNAIEENYNLYKKNDEKLISFIDNISKK
jgi:hypothetical protein